MWEKLKSALEKNFSNVWIAILKFKFKLKMWGKNRGL